MALDKSLVCFYRSAHLLETGVDCADAHDSR